MVPARRPADNYETPATTLGVVTGNDELDSGRARPDRCGMHGNSELFDLALIARVSRGDPATERRMLGEFLRLNDADLALLREAVQGGEREKVRHLAHRIRGAAQMLAASGLTEACRLLDASARAAPSQAMEAELEELLRQSARLSEAIRQHMEQPPC